ncbi:MAG: phosphoribosylformylglycinamidine cyclo-ligase [Actinomycetota bacterium]
MADEDEGTPGGEGRKKDYRWAGVDIDAADRAVSLIKDAVSSTLRPEVLTDLGGFSSLFRLDPSRYDEPVLACGTDGVGTKLKLAQMLGVHDTVGIDLVAMCADDVVCCGAEPLFFQDYLACGRVVPERISQIVGGVAEGCRKAGCALTGGEIAEHPGVMDPDDYDLSGFCVGVVERSRIIDGSRIVPEDRIVGIGSSGLHSNGFSLVRKLFFESGEFNLDDSYKGFAKPLGLELLTPSAIYAKGVLEVAARCDLKAVAHVTGGGITDNLPRVIPEDMDAVIYTGSWPVSNIFTFIRKAAGLDLHDMMRTFNMGLGMLLIVPPSEVREVIRMLDAGMYRAWEVGEVAKGQNTVIYQ